MEKALQAVFIFLINRRYIGGKHFPEKKLITSRTKWLNKQEKKEFYKEYKEVLAKDYLLRMKKRTGKDLEWHISINPRKIKEVYELTGV